MIFTHACCQSIIYLIVKVYCKSRLCSYFITQKRSRLAHYPIDKSSCLAQKQARNENRIQFFSRIKSNIFMQGIRLKEITSEIRDSQEPHALWWIHVMWEVELAEQCKFSLVSTCVRMESVDLKSLSEMLPCALLWD